MHKDRGGDQDVQDTLRKKLKRTRNVGGKDMKENRKEDEEVQEERMEKEKLMYTRGRR